MLGVRTDKLCPNCSQRSLRAYASLFAAIKGTVTESWNPVFLVRTLFGEAMKVTTDIKKLEYQNYCESCERYVDSLHDSSV